MTYLGKANVALSVVLTTASTFLASFMTPLMTKTLAGTIVPADAAGLARGARLPWFCFPSSEVCS